MSAAVASTEGTRTVRKAWKILPHDPVAIDRLSRALGIAPLVAQLLLNRQVNDPLQAQRFLKAPLSALHEPESLPGIRAAVERIHAAVAAQRRICIYGDYDVDGVSGTAILFNCLRLLGAAVEFHIPHRLEEGYGLNAATLAQLQRAGVQTVITVDCGVSSHVEADEAKRLGLELIITDHHEPKATFPVADVLVHPRLPVSAEAAPYPFGHLSGAGVAFKLAWALCKKASGSDKVTPRLREFLLDAVTLAALGTVADVVPLVDENRLLVRHGLCRLKTQPSQGLRALLQSARIDGKMCFQAGDIGYTLAPRINAAGRIDTARLAVELLTTTSTDQAKTIAEELENQNTQRQALERHMLHEARLLAEQFQHHPALVLANDGWHAGLLGIVASRLVDQFARPVLLISLRDKQPHGQGSGRSVPGFPLHRALEECTDHLVSHGGHAAAAGFRILPDNIRPFRESFSTVVQRYLGLRPARPCLTIDAETPLSALTFGTMTALEQLAPFGAGNPVPLLLADRLQVRGEPRRLGATGRHLSFRVGQHGKEFRAIAFGMGDRLEELMSKDGQVSLVFTPRLNEWQGYRSIELEVRDFQAGADPELVP